MADIADIASDHIEIEHAARLAAQPKFDGPSSHECKECGDPIPPERQKVGGRQLCVDCQEINERKR